MAFTDRNLDAGRAGLTVSGLGLTKTAALTLEVASGSVTHHSTGTMYTLTSAQNKVFTADSTDIKQVFMAIIDNGTTTDLWVDSYVDDGLTGRADPPSGYIRVLTIGWLEIAVDETVIDNGTIFRRVYT